MGLLALVPWGPVLVAGLTIASITYGALLGVFLLGTWNARANENGALVGFAAGLADDDRGESVHAVGLDLVCAGWDDCDVFGGHDCERSCRGVPRNVAGAGCVGLAFCGCEGETLSEPQRQKGERLDLIRALGPWAAAAIVIGTMVGTGIFLKPGEMAAVGGSVSVVYAAWIVGGLLSLFGALSFAELGAALPEAGGQYAYLRKGLGPVWGFLFGWMHSTVGESSSAASIAAGFARFSSFLIPAIAVPIFSWHLTSPFSGKPYDFEFTWAQPLAVGGDRAFYFHQLFGRAIGRARADCVDDFEDCFGAGDRCGGILVWAWKHGAFSSLLAGWLWPWHDGEVFCGAGGCACGLTTVGRI